MKLVTGAGSRENRKACWMSALYFYTNVTGWSDHPQCVSPVIRLLCISLNDMLSDGVRERFIGKHLFAPLGTNTGFEDDIKRAQICADRAQTIFVPLAAKYAAEHAESAKYAAESAKYAAESAKYAEHAKYAAESAKYAAESAKYAAGYAEYATKYAKYAAEYAKYAEYAEYAEYATKYAEYAEYEQVLEKIHQELLRLILDCCAIGAPAEVKTVKTKREVLEFVEADESEMAMILSCEQYQQGSHQ